MEVKFMFPPLTYKQDALHVNWYVVIFVSVVRGHFTLSVRYWKYYH